MDVESDVQKELYKNVLTKFSGLKLIDFNDSNIRFESNSVHSFYNREDLAKYLKSSNKLINQKQLRKISRFLYSSSPHYRSLINYYSTLYNFDYTVGFAEDTSYIGIDAKKAEKAYIKAVGNFGKINLKSESLSIRAHTYVDGVFFGYVRKTNKSFYIQHLDPDYCKITFLNPENGLYGYSFDFSIFATKPKLIESYPPEFKEIYNQYTEEVKRNLGWVQINSSNAICIKASNISGINPIPPLSGLFEGILDIYDFKALAKGKEKIGNYQLLFHKIPMDTSGKNGFSPDTFLLSPDFITEFHNNVADSVPDEVGVLTTPMDIEAIKFDRDSVDKNKVTEATSQYWNEAGVSELLFGNATNSTALKLSITADESSLSNVVIEIEKWINEYAKDNFTGTYKFKMKILHTTKFNQSEYIDSKLKTLAFGSPQINEVLAASGMSPSEIYLNNFLERDVLRLHEKFIPLQTSYTKTDSSDSGAPSKSDGERSDAGDQNIENDSETNS